MEASNPASVDLDTGEIYLNANTFFALDKELKKNILWHEMAHYALQTHDEFEADKWAFKRYVALGGSPKASVKAISHTLMGNNQEQFERLEKRIEMAKKADDAMKKKNLQNYAGPQAVMPPQGIVDPNDASSVWLFPEDYHQLEQQVHQQELFLNAEIEKIDEEVADLNARIAAYEFDLKRLQDAKETAEWRIEVDCEKLNNNKRRRNCRTDAIAVVDALNVQINDLDHAEVMQYRSARSQKINRKNERSRTLNEIRTVKAESRAYKRMTLADGKAYRRMSNGQAQVLRAQQGLPSGGAMVAGQAIQTAGQVAGAFLGGGQPAAQQPMSQNNMLIIGLIAAVAVGAVFFMMNKNK